MYVQVFINTTTTTTAVVVVVVVEVSEKYVHKSL